MLADLLRQHREALEHDANIAEQRGELMRDSLTCDCARCTLRREEAAADAADDRDHPEDPWENP